MTAGNLAQWANVPIELAHLVVKRAWGHQVDLHTLRSSDKRRSLVKIRAHIAAEARQITFGNTNAPVFSFWQIGRALNRDHSTIMHAVGALRK